MKKKWSFLTVFVLALSLLASLAGAASDYPNKAVTIICPLAPGGNSDLQARAFASAAEKFLGKPLVVVNKAGASGMIGGLAGAEAAPDGYTLTVLLPTLTYAIEWERVNNRKLNFTIQDDFIPIASFAVSPFVFIVPYDSPWKTLDDFVKAAKEKPDTYSYSTASKWSGSHIATLTLLKAAGGLRCRHVPMKSGGEAITALIGKHVHFLSMYPSVAIPMVLGKKARALAVLGANRIKTIPEVPTLKELNMEGESYGWVAVAAPKATPPEIVEKLRQTALKVAEDKSFVSFIEESGDQVVVMTGKELETFLTKAATEVRELMIQVKDEETKKK